MSVFLYELERVTDIEGKTKVSEKRVVIQDWFDGEKSRILNDSTSDRISQIKRQHKPYESD